MSIKKRQIFLSATHFILEKLSEAGDVVIETFFPPNYPGTELMRSFLSYRRRRYYAEKPSFSALLTKLRRQGLVKRTGSKRYAHWKITYAGKKQLHDYRKELESEKFSYAKKSLVLPEPDGIFRIISFDIPEKRREERDWLRTELAAAGFQALHKSVWTGDRPLSEALLKELNYRNLIECIHIASIKEKGTIA